MGLQLRLSFALLIATKVATNDGMAQQTVPGPGQKFLDCATCPEMVVIPPGRYTKGSPPGEAVSEGTPERDARNETPQQSAVVEKAFAISVTEITRAQFSLFVADAGYDPDWECITWDFEEDIWGARDTVWSWSDPGFEQDPDHPVLCVSFTDAQAYAAWLSKQTGQPYRLLTDEEWEYVARDHTQTARPWDGVAGADRSNACTYANVTDWDTAQYLKIDADDPDNHVFPCRDGFPLTAPVGQFPANGFGVHDILGNAWEWVDGCMYTAPEDGEEALENCDERLIRGGAWQAKAWYVRPAKRDWAPFWLRSARVGLRLAREMN